MEKARKHWFVVAHRGGARIFEQTGIQKSLRLLHDLENNPGYLKERELVTDRQGRSDRKGVFGHTAVGSETTQSDHILSTFLKKVSALLEKEALHNGYDTLVLVAGPHVLGELKKALGKQALLRLRDSISKDLAQFPQSSILTHLEGVLCEREEIRPS